MYNIFKAVVVISVYTLAIVTSVYADESCDDAIADGKAAYNSGNYTIAQKHFENVVKWCGGSYGAASNWVQNCRNKQTEIKSYTTNITVTDCQGHTYPVVKIGNQYWMAENLQCTKYDTESECAGATISISSSNTYAPYYLDGREVTTECSGNLTSTQRKKLGLLYNWAAAVGLATKSEAKSRKTAFSDRRQGICPNGWHLPTSVEWDTLCVAIGGVKDEYGHFPKASKLLKSTSGWYKNGNGTDEYSFAALPAGYTDGSTVHGVGEYLFFWTATPGGSNYAYERGMYYRSDDIGCYTEFKSYVSCVRCVKN